MYARNSALLVMSALFAASAFAAPPPRNISYQGELSTAAGAPVTGSQSIQFSLYDVGSGGAALWTETESVALAGGRFQVELGDGTAIPEELFNRQLWLGIKVGSDAEMTPRAKLNAAPVAVRALQRLDNEVLVPAEASATENGQALLAAMAVADATAGSRFTVRLDAGEYDLGGNTLVLPRNTSLVGAGRFLTDVFSFNANETVRVQGGGEVRDILIRNPGVGGGTSSSAALVVRNTDNSPAFQVIVSNAVLLADAPGTTTGTKAGAILCNSVATEFRDVVARGWGGDQAYGLVNFCDPEQNTLLQNVKLEAFDGVSAVIAMNVRGTGFVASGVEATARLSVSRAQAFVRGIALGQSTNSGLFRDIRATAEVQDGASAGDGDLFGLILSDSGFVTFTDTIASALGTGRGVVAVGAFGSASGGPSFTNLTTYTRGATAGSGFTIVAGISSNDVGIDMRESFVTVDCLAASVGNCHALSRGVGGTDAGPAVYIVDSRLQATSAQIGKSASEVATVSATGFIRIERSTLRQLSGNGRTVSIFTGGGSRPGIAHLSHSVLEVSGAPATPGGCAAGADTAADLKFFHSRLLGGICAPALCLASTTRDDTFLTNTCPTN